MKNAADLPFLSGLPASACLVDVRSQRTYDRNGLVAAATSKSAEIERLTTGRPGPVVIAEPDAAEMLITLFGAWAAGRCAVLVNPQLSDEEKQNVMAHTSACAWLGPGADGLEQPEGADGAAGAIGIDDPALILMTSGTTGVPKGIVHSLRSLSARTALNVAHIGADSLQRSLCVLPMFFGHGLIGNCLSPLAAGGTLYLWCSPGITEIASFGKVMDDHAISFLSSVPSFWKLAMRMSASPANPPRRVHIGSAPLSAEFWSQIAQWVGTQNVYNLFGMTETANWIGGGVLSEAAGRDGYVGSIWGGNYAVLLDDGTVAPVGRGEVLVQSPTIMQNYLNAPDKTREAFVSGWFRTGDIGELDEAGRVTLVGRIKTEINRAGIKIQAEEIDMLLERHPQIEEACAFAIPDPVSGEAVAAAIVASNGTAVDVDAVRGWCKERARSEAVPVVLYLLEEIPKNERGKIVRDKVREAAQMQESST
ncbi:class I adenylate-forming enzyme family protein [Hoeflea prorocentri]|uniref:Class I adenylate-forming enzyme family protein n=1 Tax=Hoeflea prorocentri TaxID=1922333 RepID=A0A9X3ZJ73_9HYPH|nr:class I adenylate-forming enzyme family protein [Hoeflea prorocentri]MCY6382621.1 class I adenylate-forming enzyme family protein [Hoeflea prorocentri]MDA5400421.1 class I adenylate-forming enzyme family protein [Hoeflea prorocentri]